MPIQCTCSECGATFYRPPSNLRTTTPCCSRTCQNARLGKKHLGVPRIGAPDPIFNADNLTARIPLHDALGVVRAYTVIDASDAQWARQWRWCLSHGRAVRNHNADGAKYMVYLHRELLGLPHRTSLPVVDHIDRNPLNNRRLNLRAIAKGDNSQNVPSRSASGYRGVSFHRQSGRWRARIKTKGIEHHLGLFATAEEAAKAARMGRSRLLPFSTD